MPERRICPEIVGQGINRLRLGNLRLRAPFLRAIVCARDPAPLQTELPSAGLACGDVFLVRVPVYPLCEFHELSGGFFVTSHSASPANASPPSRGCYGLGMHDAVAFSLVPC